MGFARVASTCTAVAAVVGCAAVAVGMSRAGTDHAVQPSKSVATTSFSATDTPHFVSPAALSRTAVALRVNAGRMLSSAAPVRVPAASRTAAPSRTAAARSRTEAPRPSLSTASHPGRVAHSSAAAPPLRHALPASRTPARHTPTPAPRRGGALPLGYSTGSATRVITVVAGSTGSTVAQFQRWTKAPGGGWWRVGASITAHIGSQGMTRYPSESRSATPMGSFSLTRAFGRYADPGTALPYTKTSPADWWISQSGALYNTMQHCWSRCAFAQGSPNEHLYYTTPFYNYAVVIDYNTRNVGPVRQGAGSAFFLHVSVGSSTAGCVAIASSDLVSVLRWLTPGSYPRILIGTA